MLLGVRGLVRKYGRPAPAPPEAAQCFVGRWSARSQGALARRVEPARGASAAGSAHRRQRYHPL